MRLVDIDSLKGCAIIRPTTYEEIAHIEACSGLIAHKDIPTAYDVEAVVAELEDASVCDDTDDAFFIRESKAIEIVRNGGKE